MTHPRKNGRIYIAKFVAVISGILMTAGASQGQAPRVGQVQRLKVITISMQVGCMEREDRRITYSPPPGWYVRSHTVECTQKTGSSSFSVNTVPQDWTSSSEARLSESYKRLLDLAGKAHDAGLEAKLQSEQKRSLSELHQSRSSHHALVVEATAKGEGLFKGRGCLQLTVTAELVYVGPDEGPKMTVARHRAKVR